MLVSPRSGTQPVFWTASLILFLFNGASSMDQCQNPLCSNYSQSPLLHFTSANHTRFALRSLSG